MKMLSLSDGNVIVLQWLVLLQRWSKWKRCFKLLVQVFFIWYISFCC